MISRMLAGAALFVALPAVPLLAQDAMESDSMAIDAMSPMTMSEENLALCLEEAAALSFPEVAMAAERACHALHNGEMMHDEMTSTPMGGDAMEGDSMSGDAMAPGQ